jgi:hypothetical protein
MGYFSRLFHFGENHDEVVAGFIGAFGAGGVISREDEISILQD